MISLCRQCNIFAVLFLLIVTAQSLDLIERQNENGISYNFPKHQDFARPNFIGCEQTKACYIDLLASTGFSVNPFPNYGTYLMKMTKLYSSGGGLKKYCGSFDAVSRCFSQESDSCRSASAFAVLFNLTRDDAYRYATDLDLRKILCDNQQEMADPCLGPSAKVTVLSKSADAQASCDKSTATLSTVISDADEWGCPDSVLSLFCQISVKTKEIETLGACDGTMRKCWSPFHSCDRMHACFDQFYDGVEKAGIKSPLPDYAAYASNMKDRFENAEGIEDLCELQESLHACLLRHVDRNCPLNAASFRIMYGMNYEQAYYYSTDFELRKTQCMHKEGMMQTACLVRAEPLLDVCEPSIPHNLTLERACTDLRLAMQCNNFAVKQFCPEAAVQMYCSTTAILYEQAALGLCDGWMPECGTEATQPPFTVSSSKATASDNTSVTGSQPSDTIDERSSTKISSTVRDDSSTSEHYPKEDMKTSPASLQHTTSLSFPHSCSPVVFLIAIRSTTLFP